MLGNRFEEALLYAVRIHDGQTRKGGPAPYAGHLLSVAGLVLQAEGSETEAIAALLHDGLEDQPRRTSVDEIRARFGEAVTRIVLECGDVTGEAPEEEKRGRRSWCLRRERYLEHLRMASPSAILVSCADKVDNVRAILRDHRALGEALWSRFNAGRENQLWYYSALAEAFNARKPDLPAGSRRLLEELDLAVGELIEAVPCEVPTRCIETRA